MTATRKSQLDRHRGERGSALLIVFLFAAVLAISLYMEMPVVAFEAKRAKEQLLIDRGTEYAHAVKLYYRKFRAYPASIDALENTNRMRFLRHKFKDPMTGEDNWRLLHAGPGGQLTDSKVNPIGLNANAQKPGSNTNGSTNNGFGSNAASTSFASNAGSAPASSGFSTQAPADNGTGVATVAGIPQRPPEMPVNGAAANPANVDPTQGLLPGSVATTAEQTQPNQFQLGQTQPGQTQATANQPNRGQSVQPGVVPGTVPFSMGVPAIPAQPIPQAQMASGSNISAPMQGVQGLFSNPNPAATAGNTAASAPMTNVGTTNGAPAAAGGPGVAVTTTAQSGMGVIQSGGIAGVASLAKGSTIKTVNDQIDYSLWEFYYDPTKDTSTTGQSGINPTSGMAQPNANRVATPAGFSPASPTAPSPVPTPLAAPPGLTPPPQ